MAEMSPAQRDAFLATPRIASLVSLNADGSPTSVPVWYEWDGKVARVFTQEGTAKVRRIEHDPRVALSVAEPVGVREAWVTIEGTASVAKDGALELARRLAKRYYTVERFEAIWPSWEAAADRWVTITITPARIRSMAPEA